MRNTTAASLFLAAALLTAAAYADDLPARPAPKGIGKAATPVTTATLIGGKTEGQAFFDSLPVEMQRRLLKEGQALWGEQKETDKGSYAGYIKAVAIFKQPKLRAWELMVVPTLQPLYLPRLTGAKTVDKPENGELVEFKLKVVFSKFKFYTRHWFYPEYSRVEWALDPKKKSDIALQEGYWQLYKLDDTTTIGEYGTRVDTGVAVPQFIQDFLARKDIPKALTAFRKYLDSNGTFRRDDD
jgi:hypothetical protein